GHFSRKVYLFCDEFTNYNVTEIGITTIMLLNAVGYEVLIPEHVESVRTHLAKGFLKEAKALEEQNVQQLKNLVTADTPLIGVEPSAIITFRDEYLNLVDHRLRNEAEHIAKYSFMVDEFIALEIDRGHIHPDQFTNET